MPRILLVAATTGYQTRSFAAAARRLGIEVTLATDRCHILEDPWRDSAIPVRFEDPEAAAQILAQTSVDGVIAVADRPTLVASLTAKKMKIPWHPPLAVAFCRDKHKMRELFALANLPTPENFLTSLNQNPRQLAANAPFPCVLKPLGLSASRGVIRANSVDEFVSAFKRIRRILEQPEIRHLHDEANDAIQIERYIEGREFALEGLMTHGELQLLALFDKPDPLEGPFFEETIYVTPSREPGQIQTEIVNTARRAVRALGLHHGSVHAEMRVNSTGVYMLEVAARPIGGLCARALRFNNGLTLEEVVILHAIGQMPDGLTLSPPALGVMMIPVPAAGIYESVAGIDDALATDGIDDVVITAKQGQKLQPLPEGASYPGFIFASGDNPFIVESALRKAHAHLRLQVLPSLDVIPY